MAKKNGNGNGDQRDQKEDSRWRCPICHQSGPCVKGDEKVARDLHIALMHPPKKK